MTTLGSRHSTRNFFRFRFAADANLLHNGSHSDPAAVDPGRDTLARELVASGQFPGAESHQVASAGRQHLRPQFTGDSPYRFLVQFQALPSQLRARLFDGQQTDQTTHLGLHVGAATFADPIGRQFRVEPASLGASSLASAPTRRAVQRHHRDRQSSQKPDHQGASFFSTGRSGTSASSITLSMWRSCLGLAHWPWPTARRRRDRPAAALARELRVPRRRSWPGRWSDVRATRARARPTIARSGRPRRLVRLPAGRRAVDAFFFLALLLVPAHLLFRLQKHFHDGLLPGC